MVVALVGIAQDQVTDAHAPIHAGAVANHDPGLRPQHGQAVRNGLGIRWPHADVDHRDAIATCGNEIEPGHLKARGQR